MSFWQSRPRRRYDRDPETRHEGEQRGQKFTSSREMLKLVTAHTEDIGIAAYGVRYHVGRGSGYAQLLTTRTRIEPIPLTLNIA